MISIQLMKRSLALALLSGLDCPCPAPVKRSLPASAISVCYGTRYPNNAEELPRFCGVVYSACLVAKIPHCKHIGI